MSKLNGANFKYHGHLVNFVTNVHNVTKSGMYLYTGSPAVGNMPSGQGLLVVFMGPSLEYYNIMVFYNMRNLNSYVKFCYGRGFWETGWYKSYDWTLIS